MSSAGASPAKEATAATGAYPDLSDVQSPTDSVIAGDFGAMSPEEQERQRGEWKEELRKTEEEIATLKQVLGSKELHAAGLKRRLGITAWREFSEDMTQGIKNLQESAAYKKTAEGVAVAKEKTAGFWNQVTSSQSFQTVSGKVIDLESKVGTAFGAAKNRISASMSHQNFNDPASVPAETEENKENGSKTEEKK